MPPCLISAWGWLILIWYISSDSPGHEHKIWYPTEGNESIMLKILSNKALSLALSILLLAGLCAAMPQAALAADVSITAAACIHKQATLRCC